MERNLEDLLRPTLSAEEQRVPIFSARACFFTAFFGGPIAIALLSAFNSHKLKRLKSDLIFYILGVVVVFVYFFLILDVPEGANVSEWMSGQRRENLLYRYGSRGMALVFWAAYYYLHRQFYKTMDLFDIAPPNPWKAAIACIVLGGFFQSGLGILILSVGGAF